MGATKRVLAASAALSAAPKKPNILFILLDDLGYGDVGCYGQKQIQTPHIDSLAREGTRFTDAYAGGPVCAPSRCVLMTGMHGGHARVRANAGTAPIGPEDKTFPLWLQTQGYVCGGFGKWGLGDAGSPGVPWKHGFDTFFGYLHQVHAHSYFRSSCEQYKGPVGREGIQRGADCGEVVRVSKGEQGPAVFLIRHLYSPAWTIPNAHGDAV